MSSLRPATAAGAFRRHHTYTCAASASIEATALNARRTSPKSSSSSATFGRTTTPWKASAPSTPSVVNGLPHLSHDGSMVRAAGLEPARAFRPYGFSYHFGFRRLATRVRGLDYPFTLAPRAP